MNILRKILTGFTVILMIIVLFYIDYSNLSWSNNYSNYIGLITGLCIILSVILSNHYEKKRGS